MLAFLGDTPAVNQVGGFKEGVSFAKRMCRHCNSTSKQMQLKVICMCNRMYNIVLMPFDHHNVYFIQFFEDFILRTKEMHKRQCDYIENPSISKSEREHYSTTYGVNRRSSLCGVQYFIVTEQLPQDLMHLLFEGLFPFHNTSVIQTCGDF